MLSVGSSGAANAHRPALPRYGQRGNVGVQFLSETKAMQQSFVQWKRRKLHECSEKPAEVAL